MPAPSFLNRELSWLGFAQRVLAQVEDSRLPLLERVKFAGIVGMLHDEFFMKRIGGLKRQMRKRSKKISLDGRTPDEELAACREALLLQVEHLSRIVRDSLRPELAAIGEPILDHDGLDKEQRKALRSYFRTAVLPILTPLAVDIEHPFPFISGLGINLAVLWAKPKPSDEQGRFVRIKVPDNRPRWVALPSGGVVPLEQVIAANLDLMFPGDPPSSVHLFRVTRSTQPERTADLTLEEATQVPGNIVRLVASELKARKFAGIVRLEVEGGMPKKLVKWLAAQLGADVTDVYQVDGFLGVSELMRFDVAGHDDLRYPPHEPVTHPRLAGIPVRDSAAIFSEIDRGDVLLHHPYHSFDTSVLRFLESAAVDPGVLAIKLTIYRTSRDSPTVEALAEAARRGKQVAVLVEITARFDEAPNIAWGQYLEKEGAHVTYGVERLKTHIKAAMVVREEAGRLRRYVHLGTGNYHSGTARIYEDLGVLSADPEVCEDVARLFNSLTGAATGRNYRKLIVAPSAMRSRFVELIQREIEHAAAGRPCGIQAKMNQLQDPSLIRELYGASSAGVPIELNVRGLCCLRPGIPGQSENIRVFSAVGRFLEHSRIYRFTNGGQPEYYLGSADWMKRNLDNRVETIVPVLDEAVQRELDEILAVYRRDNCSVWDAGPDGAYVRRSPAEGEDRRAAQEMFIASTTRAGSAPPVSMSEAHSVG